MIVLYDSTNIDSRESLLKKAKKNFPTINLDNLTNKELKDLFLI